MTTPAVRLVAMCSVAIVIVSIVTSTLWQDYPSWVWYLLAPVGALKRRVGSARPVDLGLVEGPGERVDREVSRAILAVS